MLLGQNSTSNISDRLTWDNSKSNTKELNDLLTEPLNLQTLKKIKTGRSNSGGGPKQTYLFKPNYNGFYYAYFMFPGFHESGPRIATYKKGKDVGQYMDSSEVFIELFCDEVDRDLGKANLCLLSLKQIHQKFGDNYLSKGAITIYQHNKTLLIISIGKERWFKIVRVRKNYSSYAEIEKETTLAAYGY